MNPVAAGDCQISDPCLHCSSGTGHPPMAVVYDPAAGAYAEADEETCLARRASGPGDICGAPADRWAGDVPLCAFHFKRLMSWIAEETDRTLERDRRLYEQQVSQVQELHLRQLELARERAALIAQAKSENSVVYYVRRISDGMIKIGFTGSIKNRMPTLRREHGPLQILLVLGGDHAEELAAHQMFDDYRIGKTEWFRPERAVLQWISGARQGHAYPEIQPAETISLGELETLIPTA